MSTSGSIESVSLKGRVFTVPADNEANRKIGGFENEMASNGDGTSRIRKTRVPPSLTGLQLNIDDDRGDQEFLQDLSDGSDFFPVAITLVSGKVWQGSFMISGELQYSTQSGLANVDLMGTGIMTQQ